MADASHTMAKTAPQSVAQYLPPFSHTGQCATAGRLVSLFCEQFRLPTRPVYRDQFSIALVNKKIFPSLLLEAKIAGADGDRR